MISLIFNFLINFLATVIQIIMSPINAIFIQFLPELANTITNATSSIVQVVSYFSYPLGFIPNTTKAIILFIIGCEISYHSIYLVYTNIERIWSILQKIKFW